MWKFEAIGTKWSMTLDGNFTQKKLAALKQLVLERIDRYDQTYSRFRSDSEVLKWSRPGKYLMPDDGYELFSFYKKLYDATNGKITPMIGSVMNDAGYDADYSFIQKTLDVPPPWEAALEFDHKTLTTKQPVVLDVGAAGKGYLVDIITDLVVADPAVNELVINAGGDIRRWTRTQYNSGVIRIGLENPFNHTEAIGVIEIASGSLCASSGSRRKWGTLHHIIDPDTLESPNTIVSTWVVTDQAMMADGLATALFFVTPAKLHEFNFSFAILKQDGTLTHSPNLLKEVFT